jgi:hypothetical protein
MKYLYALLVAAFPVVVAAQTVQSTIGLVGSIVASLIPIIIGIAVLVFLWGVMKYVVAKDPEAQKEARSVILYGIIVLFVMVAIWGLVELLGDTLGISTDNTIVPTAPRLPR